MLRRSCARAVSELSVDCVACCTNLSRRSVCLKQSRKRQCCDCSFRAPWFVYILTSVSGLSSQCVSKCKVVVKNKNEKVRTVLVGKLEKDALGGSSFKKHVMFISPIERICIPRSRNQPGRTWYARHFAPTPHT